MNRAVCWMVWLACCVGGTPAAWGMGWELGEKQRDAYAQALVPLGGWGDVTPADCVLGYEGGLLLVQWLCFRGDTAQLNVMLAGLAETQPGFTVWVDERVGWAGVPWVEPTAAGDEPEGEHDGSMDWAVRVVPNDSVTVTVYLGRGKLDEALLEVPAGVTVERVEAADDDGGDA